MSRKSSDSRPTGKTPSPSKPGVLPELILALDVPNVRALGPVLKRVGAAVHYFKVGLELFCSEGPSVLHPLQDQNKKIFLDLKLHDIPRTVARTVQSIARHDVALTTLHAAGGKDMLRAAVEAAREAGPKAPALLAVTVLTSLNQDDFSGLGIGRTPEDQVLAMADLALAAGVDGLVCSPREAKAIRSRFGPEPLLVTPGIRPAGADPGDQKRTASPADAVRAGATHLVVGRPILDAPDPQAAAAEILAQMASAAR